MMETSKVVLLIDSDANSRTLLSFRLQDQGFKVLEAGFLFQIDKVLSETDVDVIVTDWSVPGFEGEDLIRLLQTRRQPVLLFTNHQLEDSASFMAQTGVKSVIPKLDRDDWLRILVQTRRWAFKTGSPFAGSIYG
jgi:DNA-binding response OmpR family regulator